MANLPVADEFIAPTVTEAQFKGALQKLISFLTDLNDLTLRLPSARTSIADNTALLIYTDNGQYYGTTNLTIADRPVDAKATRQFMLEVKPYTANNRFKIQVYQEVQIDLLSEWQRVIDTQLGTVIVDWTRFNFIAAASQIADSIITATKLASAVVDRTKLTDNYLYNGVLNGISMNTVTKDGTYVVTGGMTDKPAGSSSAALVRITAHNTFILQQWQDTADSQKTWSRVIRPNASTPVVETWKSMNPALPIAGPSVLGGVKIGAGLSIDEQGVLKASGGGGTGSSPYSGKNLVCFGDSITEFGDYPDRIKMRLGLNSAVNVGFGGCRMAAHESVKYTEMSMFKLANTVATQDFTNLDLRAAQLAAEGDDNTAVVARLKAVNFANVDYVTIFYGTNDFAAEVPIGSNTDADGTTFKGAINYTINKLLTAYPHLKIMFVAPYWRARMNNGDGLESDSNANDLGKYLIEYVDAIKEVAALNKIPVLDMYRNSGINKYNATLYFTDGLHPTAPVGFQHVADKISAFISATV